MKTILNKIKEYDTIIIHRHVKPDLDALGSQLGLALAIEENFKDKKVYVVGDSSRYKWVRKMDDIEDEVFNNALCIICDVAEVARISDNRFLNAKERIVIDHHRNASDFDCYEYINPNYGAAALLVAEFIIESKLKMTPLAATYLYAGVITDTGRFRFTLNDSLPMRISADLLDNGADTEFLYDELYQETLKDRQILAHFTNRIQYTRNNLAYLKNDEAAFEEIDMTGFNGFLLDTMTGIKEVDIWINSTYNKEDDVVGCSVRSKKVHIVDVVRKYGGGGHYLASGCRVDSFDTVDKLINDLDNLLPNRRGTTMDYEIIFNKIKEYDTIIIHRHMHPDFDALGSQLGLLYTLRNKFPNKKIYAVGDENHLSIAGRMDVIEDNVFNDALCIICDCSQQARIADNRFLNAKERIVIDHHETSVDFDAHSLVMPIYGSCSEIIAEFVYDNNLEMTVEAASIIYAGIISDTGKFAYTKNDPNPFIVCSKLLASNADLNFIDSVMNTKTLEDIKVENYFSSSIIYTTHNVAYMMNDKDVVNKFDKTSYQISRGMVSLMGGVKEVPIWCNFTYDTENNNVMCEFRSKEIVIVDIAKKYGGGGHNLACGATVKDFEVCKEIINDFIKLVEESGE
ncbi:MAG: bifunctional oligoribonuclease/PAP phosphatase NrnA [bacterium]